MTLRSGVMTVAMVCAAATALAEPVRPVPDPAGLMRAIAMQPFRYGGDLDGSLLGLPEIGAKPVHLAMGLGAPARNGTVSGSAILFDNERHLIAQGRIDGIVRPEPGAETASCALRLRLDGVALLDGAAQPAALPAGTVRLVGQCGASSLAGEIRSATPRPALVGRLINWWGDRHQVGRFWLTADSFDPPPAPVMLPVPEAVPAL